ncbi:MAG: PAS domain S-box protein, partial [Clostridia bacterium]
MNKNDKSPEEQLRLRAEMQIKEKREKASYPASLADLQRIVHELEVYQIELEMQNDELTVVRSSLESLLNQYTDLYDFAPVGYFTLDSNGKILKANLTGASLLGMERPALLNRPFGFFVLPEYRPILNTFLKTVFESQSRENCEVAILKEEKELFFVHIEAMALDTIQQCHIAVIDVTEQTLTQKKLSESEHLFHSLFKTITQGIVFLSPTHRIISINPAATRIPGLSMDLIQGASWPVPGWRVIREDGSVFPREEQPSEIAFRSDTIVVNVVMGITSPKAPGCTWLKVDAVPQHSFMKANPCQVILIIEDITHLKRIESYNTLTNREKQVFSLLARNLSRHTIAETLRIKPK